MPVLGSLSWQRLGLITNGVFMKSGNVIACAAGLGKLGRGRGRRSHLLGVCVLERLERATSLGRGLALIGASAVIFAGLAGSMLGQIPAAAIDVSKEIALENRLTKIEAVSASTLETVKDLKSNAYLAMLALSGLLGESGFRVLARRRRRLDDSDGAGRAGAGEEG